MSPIALEGKVSMVNGTLTRDVVVPKEVTFVRKKVADVTLQDWTSACFQNSNPIPGYNLLVEFYPIPSNTTNGDYISYILNDAWISSYEYVSELSVTKPVHFLEKFVVQCSSITTSSGQINESAAPTPTAL